MPLELNLSSQQLAEVRDIVASLVPHAQFSVFGSRATGHARPHSDLDLLFTKPPRLTWEQRANLTDAFEASTLPFCVDVVEEACLASGMAARIHGEMVRI